MITMKRLIWITPTFVIIALQVKNQLNNIHDDTNLYILILEKFFFFVIFFINIVRDLNLKYLFKKHVEQIRMLKRRFKKQMRAQNCVILSISHELRNPLNSLFFSIRLVNGFFNQLK